MPRRKQKNPHDLGFDQQGILRYSTKTQSTKEKPDESDFIKVRSAARGSPATRGGKTSTERKHLAITSGTNGLATKYARNSPNVTAGKILY